MGNVGKTPTSERTLGASYTDSTLGLTPDEEKLLKASLGDADGDADNNVEVYNWDYGTPNSTGNGQDPYEQVWMSHLNLPSVGVTMTQEIGLQMVVKFDPSGSESYEYVAPCSGRGLCNE